MKKNKKRLEKIKSVKHSIEEEHLSQEQATKMNTMEAVGEKEQTKRTEKAKQKKHDWHLWVAIVCFVIAAALFSLGPIRTMILSQFQQEANQTLETITVADIESNASADADFDFTKVEELDLEGVMSARFKKEPYLTIGAIAVPAVELNLPIIRGVSNAGLYVGAGTMKPDQVMGEKNYCLASHNYPGKPTILFSPLERLKIGDKIYITDLKNIYEYETTVITTVDQHQVDILNDIPNETIITLMKCNDNDYYRDIYQGKLIQKVAVDEAPEAMKEVFNVDFTQHEK